MKLLFIHNDRVKEDIDGNLYTGGSYNQVVWERYLQISNNLTVMLKKERKIYSVEDARNKFNFFESNKIKFIELPDLYRSIKDFVSVKNRKEIYRQIDDAVEKADIIIIRSVASLACRRAIRMAKKRKKIYVVEVTGIAWRSLWYHGLRGKMLAVPVEVWNRYYIAKAPNVVYVTQRVLQKCYPNKHNNVGISDVEIPDLDDAVLSDRCSRLEKKEEYSLKIGTIGNVDVKPKNHELVIRAMSIMKERGYHVTYELVGYGNNARLKEIARKYNVEGEVRFIGGMAHEQIFPWIDTLDCYIQPSKQEGMPRALIEAASRACPVAGASVGGIPEVVDDQFCFKPDDEKAVAEILKKLMDKTIRKEQAVRSFEVSKQFQKSILDDKRKIFYRELLKEFSKGDLAKV